MFQLQCTYQSSEEFRQSVERQKSGLLGALCFSKAQADIGDALGNMPFARVPMTCLDTAGVVVSACEAWHAGGTFVYGRQGQLLYGHNENVLFGSIQLSEAEFDSASAQERGKTPLHQAAELAYRAIFELTEALDFPAVFRFWNYIADINGHSHGMERYRQFNMGRQDGFLARGHTVAESVPAASAVGFEAGPLTVYFLAARNATPVFVENPRQVSAYRYPAEYGPRSPTFSRANVVRLGERDIFFLSGTASIVGHKTLHAGDVIAQTRETLANIDAVIAEANRLVPGANFMLDGLCYKVYVRHAEDVATVHDELRRALGPSAQFLFLHADICRSDLLVEIEATAGHPLAFSLSV